MAEYIYLFNNLFIQVKERLGQPKITATTHAGQQNLKKK